MATSDDAVEVLAVSTLVASRQPILPLILAVVFAVVATSGILAGGAYLLIRSGRLAVPTAAQSVTRTVAPEPTRAPATHTITLEPMVANLADADGKSFLRIGMTLRVSDARVTKGEKAKEEQAKQAKGPTEAEVAVRDVALEVLGRQTSEALLAPDGKEHLKAALKSSLAKRDSELKVAEIFFTEFLVQR